MMMMIDYIINLNYNRDNSRTLNQSIEKMVGSRKKKNKFFILFIIFEYYYCSSPNTTNNHE
jgi:hypothetical protein